MAIKKMTRPFGGDHNLMYDMRRVLDELGVAEGEEFLVGVGNAEGKLDSPDENALGGFSRGSDTSRKAAIDNYPRSGSQRYRCLVAIARAGATGRTFDELRQELNLYSADRRLSELKDGGWIEANGDERKTQHGSDAVVYVLTAKGEREVKAREGIDAGVLL